MKHYNGCTIWGILDKYEEKETETGKPFLEVFVNCQHHQYGNVRVLGRVWGKDNMLQFTEMFRRGSEIRLEGNMQQYTGRNGQVKTTFNFYKFNYGPLKEQKAAFRLTGIVQEPETQDAASMLKLLVRQENEGYAPKDEIFTVIISTEASLSLNGSNDPGLGDLVRVKGYLQVEEDEFGDTKGPQMPVAKNMEIITAENVS